jgi:hypothetical protein
VEDKKIDACAMLKADEVTPIIGPNDGGQSAGEGSCMWENPENSYSISLDIGIPRTAPNGTVPPDEPGFETQPGPDGIRFASTGMARFTMGDRLCDIQVATATQGKQVVQDAVVKLIGLVRGRA